MTTQVQVLRFGTRGSDLARWQTTYVTDLLRLALPDLAVEIEIIKTRGDHVLDTPLPLIGGKGVFTAELEEALHSNRIDSAVHSLKDLPTEQPPGLVIAAIPIRAPAEDVLVSRQGFTLATLPQGATVGTSSTRRAAQLRHQRPDLKIIDIRGNVDTRIRKALDPTGSYDAIVLARAGLERLGRQDMINEIIDINAILPAPGQGAIAVQTRDDPRLVDVIRLIDHPETALAVTAERAFLAGLGGGCSVPVAAYAYWRDRRLLLRGRVSALDGSQQIDVEIEVEEITAETVYQAGVMLAQQALDQGANQIMEQ